MTAEALETPGPLLAPANYVTIALAAALTGLSEKAIRRKIEEGIWLERQEYIRKDGHVFISMRGYDRWVEKGRASKPASGQSGSPSPSRESRSVTP